MLDNSYNGSVPEIYYIPDQAVLLVQLFRASIFVPVVIGQHRIRDLEEFKQIITGLLF